MEHDAFLICFYLLFPPCLKTSSPVAQGVLIHKSLFQFIVYFLPLLLTTMLDSHRKYKITTIIILNNSNKNNNNNKKTKKLEIVHCPHSVESFFNKYYLLGTC